MATKKQQLRQNYRENGKYAKVNPCYLCGKSAGVDYNSHHLTDSDGSDGIPFDDVALCICDRCEVATRTITTKSGIIDFAAKNGIEI